MITTTEIQRTSHTQRGQSGWLIAMVLALSGCASAELPITHSIQALHTDNQLGQRVRQARHHQTLDPRAGSDAQLPAVQTAQAARASHPVVPQKVTSPGERGGSGSHLFASQDGR